MIKTQPYPLLTQGRRLTLPEAEAFCERKPLNNVHLGLYYQIGHT